MTAVFRNFGHIIEVDGMMIATLINEAEKEPKRRARLNLHTSDEDPIHEMIIAFRKDSLNMPHRHVGKSESMHVMQGQVDVVTFNDEGKVLQRIRLSHSGTGPSVFRMGAPIWHTVIPVTDVVVVHETTNGPFVPGKNMEIPPWAPAESELAAWVDKLRVL